MSAEAYQRLLMKKKEKAFDHIDRRSREFRQTMRARTLPLSTMIREVKLILCEMERITWSNHR